ncbi:uncharacterized protein KIAA1755 homolog [Centrocercus urophasianus]|uniref:uncharacterized protein KIAA1755 homolog n=1 Tax=Centrocercus urophasianus TaxID=9002 RepID=UPI001C650F81|nr:uncharacterized protein KIAA1755 homolog [Centrocercus urophasianus]
MDSQSLDAAVQSALRSLYPPFEATAPTVLGQVFRLLESSYQGDGLCCLLDFLIPAKRLFEHVRRAACAPYSNCIFLHEGWPLCLHEKVVVHLAPLNPLLLRAGDFYLQAEPCQEHTARIALKHLSPDLDSVQETPIPEAAYALLFTNEWLEEINCNHAGSPLHTCLVATENGITPLPWSKIASPEFVDKPKAGPSGTPVGAPGGPSPEPAAPTEPVASITPTPHGTAQNSAPHSNIAGIVPGCRDSRKPNQGRYPGLIKVEQAGLRQNPTTLAIPSLQDIISQNLEGEYVELLQLSQQDLGLLATSRSVVAQPWTGSWPCGGVLSSQEGPCTPCQRRRLSGEPGPHGSRCRHRDSYLAALQNPVSFGSALMAAILEEPDSSAPLAEPLEPCGSRAGTPCPRRARAGGSGGQAVGQRSPHVPSAPTRSEAAGSGHKFSFLKGPRLGDSAGSQHEGGWRKVSAIYSPRMGRAKPAGKGADVAAAAPAEERSLQSTIRQNGPSMLWQELHTGLLHSGIVCLPGGTDKLGRALLQVTTSSSTWGATWCSAAELARLLLCLCSLPRKDAKDSGLTAVVDARKQPPSPTLYSALRSIQNISPGCIHTVLLLAEKEPSAPREKLPGLQVETLTSLKALGRFVDSSQVTAELEGSFPYCHGEWVQFFQRLQPFTASLGRALELLQSCIQELQSTDGAAGMQDAAAGIERHQELMRRVLSDPQLLCLQHEGGAVLARLRRDAARLRASPHVRAGMDAAEARYAQLEEELHLLVSLSNSRLERLSALRKVRELEGELDELRQWLDGEGAARLREMGAEECSSDSCERSTERWSEFLLQAAARHRHGLALCEQADKLQDSVSPEAQPLQAAVALIRTKLMSFQQRMERRQAELEMLHELHQFSSKITCLNAGCRQCSAQAKHGGVPAGRPEALQRLESSFQRLSVEFSTEKLQEMRAQLRRMQSSSGTGAWTAAWHKYQETRQSLEAMLAELWEGSAATAPGRGAVQASGRPSAGSSCGRAAGTERRDAARSPPSSPRPRCSSLPTCGSGTPPRTNKSPSQLRSPPCCVSPSPPRAPLCGQPPAHGSAHPRGDATQYFQVSSHSSFSSEDSDTQNSAEETPATISAVPQDLGPPGSPQKPSPIVYLENHRATGLGRADTK